MSQYFDMVGPSLAMGSELPCADHEHGRQGVVHASWAGLLGRSVRVLWHAQGQPGKDGFERDLEQAESFYRAISVGKAAPQRWFQRIGAETPVWIEWVASGTPTISLRQVAVTRDDVLKAIDECKAADLAVNRSPIDMPDDPTSAIVVALAPRTGPFGRQLGDPAQGGAVIVADGGQSAAVILRGAEYDGEAHALSAALRDHEPAWKWQPGSRQAINFLAGDIFGALIPERLAVAYLATVPLKGRGVKGFDAVVDTVESMIQATVPTLGIHVTFEHNGQVIETLDL